MTERIVDPLYDEAKKVVSSHGFASVAKIQREMRIGYTRAARLVDLMVEDNFVHDEYDADLGGRQLIACKYCLDTGFTVYGDTETVCASCYEDGSSL